MRSEPNHVEPEHPRAERRIDVVSGDDESQEHSEHPGVAGESSGTDSSSAEEAAEHSHSGRLVYPPTAPVGTKLIQHQGSKMLHLMRTEHSRVFICGCATNQQYSLQLMLRWNTACCSKCWRASGIPLGPRLK